MQTPQIERRRYPRTVLSRPCKVYRHATRRFIAARTLDVSGGGTLLSLDTARPLSPGEEIDLIIAWDTSGVVPIDSMLAARTVRTHRSGPDNQTVAVQFEVPTELAAAA